MLQPKFRRPPRILAVDDDPAMRVVLSHVAQSIGCVPVVAASAAEARFVVEHHQFDLIFLDSYLADGSGIDLARYIRHDLSRQTPIVVISSDDSPEHLRNLLGAGADACYVKPISTYQLRRLMSIYGLAPGQ